MLITKYLNAEARFTGTVRYFPVAGASVIENYRSPDFYVFLLFEKCSGIHTVDFIDYQQKDLQLHISFPGQIHSWNSGSETIGHKLLVSKSLIETSLFVTQFAHLKSNGYPVIDISHEVFNHLVREFSAIGHELGLPTPSWDVIHLRTQLVTAITNRLLEEVTDVTSIQKITHPVLVKFQFLVEEYFREMRSVAEYAEKLFVSANYLSALCRKFKGVPPKKIIDQRIILETKRLLYGTDMSIKDLANNLGFPDPASFSNFFKSNTGMYPKKYKNGASSLK